MCEEIAAQASPQRGWRQMSEEELLHEVAICVCGSQMLFELAVATADHLRDRGLLRPDAIRAGAAALERRMVIELSTPVSVSTPDGPLRQIRPRFKNRLA